MNRLLELPKEKQAAVSALVMGRSNELTRVRRLSPQEVFNNGRRDLIKLPPHAAAILIGPDRGRVVTVRKHMIEIEDREISPSPLRYLASHLPEGEKYKVVLNPYHPEQLFLFDAKGGYIGACQQWKSVCRADTEALQRACAKAVKVEAELLKPVADRGAAITRKRMKDARHNAAVISGAPVTQAEKDEARRIKQSSADISDFITPDDTGSAPVPETEDSQLDAFNLIK